MKNLLMLLVFLILTSCSTKVWHPTSRATDTLEQVTLECEFQREMGGSNLASSGAFTQAYHEIKIFNACMKMKGFIGIRE